MLPVGAPATEVARLGEVLRALARDDAEGFDALFDPLAPRLAVAGVDPGHAAALRAFALVAGEADALTGQHRIRRIDGRFYVMEVGGLEYVQDVWPETDALLARLETAPPGAFADVGTGCGVIAIEAAARGHRVVATDLYDSALALARFNAILNGVEIDFRRGHLFEPLTGERFDLVLTAPHYGRQFDQLRLEVLRDGHATLAPGGRIVLASMFEWQDDSGPLGIESLFPSLTARGLSVRVAPIEAELKRHWHQRAVGDVPRLVSRWRFTVEVARDGRGEMEVVRPPVASLPVRVHVSLARLREAPAAAAWTVVDGADVAELGRLCAALAGDELTIDAALPSLLVDACRFGARPCVAPKGQAAGAIVDAGGEVRPCIHGQPLARATDGLAQLLAAQEAAAAQLWTRRGCSGCAAVEMCSRCLFPAPFADERSYCTFMRAHIATLPRVRRLVETLARLGRRGLSAPVRVRRWPRAMTTPATAVTEVARLVADAWNAREAWLVEVDGTHHLFWMRGTTLHDAEIEPMAAMVGAAIVDG
ncbi:MAG: methyltransferase small, partial [Myxococcales bacterium]|nr:methyltransferase small [Myxococcales bacterium]